MGVTVTIGLGGSVLTSRLATKLSKPDGILYLSDDRLFDHI